MSLGSGITSWYDKFKKKLIPDTIKKDIPISPNAGATGGTPINPVDVTDPTKGMTINPGENLDKGMDETFGKVAKSIAEVADKSVGGIGNILDSLGLTDSTIKADRDLIVDTGRETTNITKGLLDKKTGMSSDLINAINGSKAPVSTVNSGENLYDLGKQKTQVVSTERSNIDKNLSELNTLAEALKQRMSGNTPSSAENQAKQDLERALKQQMATAASLGSSPMAQRIAQQNIATTQQQANADLAQLKLAEQIEAQKQFQDLTQYKTTLETQIAESNKKDVNASIQADKDRAINTKSFDITKGIDVSKFNTTQEYNAWKDTAQNVIHAYQVAGGLLSATDYVNANGDLIDGLSGVIKMKQDAVTANRQLVSDVVSVW